MRFWMCVLCVPVCILVCILVCFRSQKRMATEPDSCEEIQRKRWQRSMCVLPCVFLCVGSSMCGLRGVFFDRCAMRYSRGSVSVAIGMAHADLSSPFAPTLLWVENVGFFYTTIVDIVRSFYTNLVRQTISYVSFGHASLHREKLASASRTLQCIGLFLYINHAHPINLSINLSRRRRSGETLGCLGLGLTSTSQSGYRTGDSEF